jgi:tetratricopeptide (TPR) repeat protein
MHARTYAIILCLLFSLSASARSANVSGEFKETDSLDQKLKQVDATLNANNIQRRQQQSIQYLEGLLQSGRLGDEAQVPLLSRLAEQASRAGLYDQEQQVCQRILADAAATPGQRGATMLRQARILERQRQLPEALARAEAALDEFDRGIEAGLDLNWHTMDSLRWAGAFAREVMLAPTKAMVFFNKMMAYTGGDYWMVPARLELALTYRQMGRFAEAEAEYEAIDRADERYRSRSLLPRAEMFYYEMGRQEQGARFLAEALATDAIRTNERYRALFKLADHLCQQGQRQAALQWYERYAKMPKAPERDLTRYEATVYLRMGQIHASLGDRSEAKRRYRQAMDLDGGDMRSRVLARHAWEDLLYLEASPSAGELTITSLGRIGPGLSPQDELQGTPGKWDRVRKVLGVDAERVIIKQLGGNLGGNTSVRNEAPLIWKDKGYYRRARDLGQVFTAPRDFILEAIVLRTGNAHLAFLPGAAGAEVFVQFFDVTGTPVIHDNGTPPGTAAQHGFSTNHRCDDFVEGVEYKTLRVVTGGTLPDLAAEGEATLTYMKWAFAGPEPLRFQQGKRYAFMVGFVEPAPERNFTLCNRNNASSPREPAMMDGLDTYPGGWGLRREGSGKTPPLKVPGEQPPEDSATLMQLKRESAFAQGEARYAITPTCEGYPDVDTYRDLEFYIIER